MKRRSISLLFLLTCPVLFGYNSGIEQAIINSDLEALIRACGNKKLSQQDKAKYLDLADQVIQHRHQAIQTNNVFPKHGPLPPHLQEQCIRLLPLVSVMLAGTASVIYVPGAWRVGNGDNRQRATISLACLGLSLLWNAMVNSGRQLPTSLYKEYLEQQYQDALRIKQRVYDA